MLNQDRGTTEEIINFIFYTTFIKKNVIDIL